MAQWFDDDDLEKRMERVLVRRKAMWPNKAPNPVIPESDMDHHDRGRCICDTCSDARPQRPLPELARKVDYPRGAQQPRATPERHEAIRPRYVCHLNSPVSVLPMDTRALLFTMRLLDPIDRKPKQGQKYTSARLIKKENG